MISGTRVKTQFLVRNLVLCINHWDQGDGASMVDRDYTRATLAYSIQSLMIRSCSGQVLGNPA